ncbi:MAG TPA: NAD(P)-dependent oxidoreductase [Candidatus Hydrogenedentes bacterium]|nr:NAD(P)-dependent oxidoreductase [Candidatus Hydrogenedentota bacterium]HNT87245.1 NAD(P)-dependent oxidoreductase [Candidatus Hydrogenedentota bacterium]
MDVGIVGLGLVGKAMAARLLAAGHAVCGCDIALQACQAAATLGVRVLPEARDVAAAASTLFLCLMTSEDRRALLWGRQAMAQALQEGALLLDITTARPEDIEVDHARLAQQGARLIDVCLSGSSEVISRGEALALVGDREADASYRELLAAFTKAQYFFDLPGQGNRMKLIVNMVFGLNRLVLAEALGVAAKAGFDLATVLDVLKAGETYSVAMDTKGPKMIARRYDPPVARLAQHAKDVRLILEFARTIGARAPVSELHARLLQEVVDRGAGECDNAAIFEAYRQ